MIEIESVQYWLKKRECTYSIDYTETYFYNTPWDFFQIF